MRNTNSNQLLLINTLTPEDVQSLNQIGICQLEDIAKLDDASKKWITKELNLLEGRIEYEYWIEQACEYLENPS